MNDLFSFTQRNAILSILFLGLSTLLCCKKNDNGPSIGKLNGNWICSGQYHSGEYVILANDTPSYIIDTTFTIKDTLSISISNLDSSLTIIDIVKLHHFYFPIDFSGKYNICSKDGNVFNYCNNYDPNSSTGPDIEINYYYKENRIMCTYWTNWTYPEEATLNCTQKY